MSSCTPSVYKQMSNGNARKQHCDSLLSVQGSTSLFQETDGVSSHWNSKSVNKAYLLDSGQHEKSVLLLVMCQSVSLIILLS